jgi:nicotinamidase-related amidase
MVFREHSLPSHFDPARVSKVWRVPYQERATQAEQWAKRHKIQPAAKDKFRVCLVLVDLQNTFCIPEFELYVGGRSGSGAVDDNRRLCEFIYRNLSTITQICPTLDTHQAMQIFHSIFLIDEKGEHPAPFTLISQNEIKEGKWKFNPAIGDSLRIDPRYGQKHLSHYMDALKQSSKYDLTVWPYHAMLGGIGHAVVSSVEEAIFFHSVARYAQPSFQIKGNHPLTEHYSVIGPEVLEDCEGKPIAQKNSQFIELLLQFDAVIIAGQAKSHCVAWTIDGLLDDKRIQEKNLAQKIYLLEDCTSPVIVPGVIDHTDQANAAFERFAKAGVHLVRSVRRIETWPGLPESLKLTKH